jgi:hypothetical protein
MESRLRFWDSMRPWFLARGYTLYQYNYKYGDELEDYVVTTYPAVPAEGETHWPYPYAVQATDSPTSPVPPLSGIPLVCFFIRFYHLQSPLILTYFSGPSGFCPRLPKSPCRH